MEAKLVVLEGKQKDREVPLPETIFLIGRDRQCHLRPHCSLVSKLHCAIAAWAGKVRVRDLKSSNGTFLNGQPIDGEVAAADGDQLRVGTLVFAFRVKTEEGAPLPAPIKEGDVKWLLDAPADSAVLLLDGPTSEQPALPTLSEAARANPGGPGPVARKRGGIGVSAGQHLRDYFKEPRG
jgi:pSer/pThr/pTyr-binding forkhead associated (FHA) protein